MSSVLSPPALGRTVPPVVSQFQGRGTAGPDWPRWLPPWHGLAEPSSSSVSSSWGTGAARLQLLHTDHRGTGGCPRISTRSIRCVVGMWWAGCTITGDAYSQRLKNKSMAHQEHLGEGEKILKKNENRKGYAGVSPKLLTGWTCKDCVFQIMEKSLSY